MKSDLLSGGYSNMRPLPSLLMTIAAVRCVKNFALVIILIKLNVGLPNDMR